MPISDSDSNPAEEVPDLATWYGVLKSGEQLTLSYSELRLEICCHDVVEGVRVDRKPITLSGLRINKVADKLLANLDQSHVAQDRTSPVMRGFIAAATHAEDFDHLKWILAAEPSQLQSMAETPVTERETAAAPSSNGPQPVFMATPESGDAVECTPDTAAEVTPEDEGHSDGVQAPASEAGDDAESGMGEAVDAHLEDEGRGHTFYLNCSRVLDWTIVVLVGGFSALLLAGRWDLVQEEGARSWADPTVSTYGVVKATVWTVVLGTAFALPFFITNGARHRGERWFHTTARIMAWIHAGLLLLGLLIASLGSTDDFTLAMASSLFLGLILVGCCSEGFYGEWRNPTVPVRPSHIPSHIWNQAEQNWMKKKKIEREEEEAKQQEERVQTEDQLRQEAEQFITQWENDNES